jgi:signal transduction histidine kinase
MIELERARNQVERRQSATALALANARLRELSARLVDAQERERTHIARELHDGLGQVLTSLVIQLHASRCSESPKQAELCRNKAIDLAQQAIQQVKSMSFDLRPAQLELLGFVPAVKATLERLCSTAGLKSFVRLRSWWPQPVLPAHTVGLRILQEGLTNVLRHAAATLVIVRVRFIGTNHFVMTLGDDGCGYDVQAVLAGGMSEKNIGLYGMLERAELMGGQLRFRSSLGRGSVMRLTL